MKFNIKPLRKHKFIVKNRVMKNLSKIITRTLAVLVVLSVYFWLVQSSFWLLNKASTIANIIGLLGLGIMTVIGLVAIYNFINYIKGKL